MAATSPPSPASSNHAPTRDHDEYVVHVMRDEAYARSPRLKGLPRFTIYRLPMNDRAKINARIREIRRVKRIGGPLWYVALGALVLWGIGHTLFGGSSITLFPLFVAGFSATFAAGMASAVRGLDLEAFAEPYVANVDHVTSQTFTDLTPKP